MQQTAHIAATAALFSLLFAASLSAQTPVPTAEQPVLPSIESLEKASVEAFAAGDAQKAYESNLALHERRPYSAQYMYDAVRAAALLDNKQAAYEMMLRMQRQGISYDFDQTDDTINIRKTEVYRYINDLMVEAGKPAGEATPAFKLAGSPADFQAIVWDDSRKKFLVGTAARGTVLAVAADGSSEVLLQADAKNGMWSVNGLAADRKHNRLWISSAATERFSGYSPTDENMGALLEFDLETLELLGRYLLPVDRLAHELGSLAVTDDGHIYILDRAYPIVYRKGPEADHLEAFVANRQLGSFSDLAVVPDNSRLFVADRIGGVFVVDPIAKQAAMLSGPENLNLGGIEGIEYAAGNLYIVQGGFLPPRLMRLKLAGSGSEVESVAPMAVAISQFVRPGAAAIQGDALYYFANRGETTNKEGVLVMQTPLEAGNEIVPPDMRKFQESMKNRKQ